MIVLRILAPNLGLGKRESHYGDWSTSVMFLLCRSKIIIVRINVCRDIFDQAEQDMPHAINVTPAEQEAIERVCTLFPTWK